MPLFGLCKSLALRGHVEYRNYGTNLGAMIRAVTNGTYCYVVDRGAKASAHAIYVDPYDCDLRIYYNYESTNFEKPEERLKVCLGSRIVYSCGLNSIIMRGEKCVDGIWKDYVNELDYDAQDVNAATIWLCREESKRNRIFLEKYYEYGRAVAETLGTQNGNGHTFKKDIMGKELIVRSGRSRFGGDMYIDYDGSCKFSFVWSNVPDTVLHDPNKSGRFVGGPWEEILESIYFSL